MHEKIIKGTGYSKHNSTATIDELLYYSRYISFGWNRFFSLKLLKHQGKLWYCKNVQNYDNSWNISKLISTPMLKMDTF